MQRRAARVIAASLLGLMVAAGGAGVAKAATALAHACCGQAERAASPGDDADCHGFLPLSCCHAAALPASEPAPPVAPALPSATSALTPASPHALALHVERASTPRASPRALSVVLQV
jgi:hypothetical protein